MPGTTTPSATTLFLLTNAFPFGRGEEFIENEIGHLSRAFDRVVVAAIQTRPGDTQTRTVPGNVEVIRAGGPRPSGRDAVLPMLRGLPRLPRGSFTREALRRPRLLALDALFEQHCRDTADDLLTRIPGLRLEPGSHAVVYAYWFLDTARVATLLAADLEARGVVVDRVVSRAHRYDLYEERRADKHLPERRLLLESLSAVCPVSEMGSRKLRAQWPATASKVHTHYLGTVEPSGPAACSREPFHILSCSFLSPVKRVDRIPAILSGLRSRGVDAVWTHLGDGQELGAVRDAVRSAGLEEVVDLRGHVPNTEIVETEREVGPTCFLNLSSSEGLPVSMMEVASLGIPIIATDVGGVAEIVEDGVNGRLLTADFSDDQAVDALVWLAELDQNAYDDVCAASRSTWERHFNETVVYPEFCRGVLQ